MDSNLPDANSALLDYIDALLVEEAVAMPTPSPAPAPTPSPTPAPAPASTPTPPGQRLLFFKVAGIPLAIVADDITAVIDGAEAGMMRRIDGEDRVLAGSFDHQGREIQIIDSRAVILPPGHPARAQPLERCNGRLLVLAGYDLALWCDEAGQVVAVERSEVEWRVERQTRLWLAGMVKGHNHALLDVEGLIRECGLGSFLTH